MSKARLNISLHFLMAFIGGYIGGYAILWYAGVFANAQTAFMINAVFALFGSDLEGFVLRIIGVVIYMCGIAFTSIWQRKTKINVHLMAIILDIIGVCIMAVTRKTNGIAALYPAFFIMAVQYAAFDGVAGHACSTIFSTNNLRQFTLGLMDYIFTRRQHGRQKLKIFGGTILSFNIGAASIYLAVKSVPQMAILLCLLPLCAAILVSAVQSHTKKETEK